jgi:UDPglucose 6-dehydrogenase
MREAPSLAILPRLIQQGAVVKAYDPAAMGEAGPLLPGVEMCADAEAAVAGADAVVVLTEWNEFRAFDLGLLRERMRGTIVVDLRNIYDPATMKELGFAYSGLGRGGLPGGVADRIADAAE